MRNMFNIQKYMLTALVTCCLLLLTNNTLAISKDSLNISELKSFVESGIEFIKETGKEKAYREFSKTNGKFVRNGMYFFVYDYRGKCLAHGGNPSKFVGKNWLSFKDKLGVPVIQLLIAIAKGNGGFAGYYWPNPKTKQENFRIVYVKAIDDNTLIGSGFWIQ